MTIVSGVWLVKLTKCNWRTRDAKYWIERKRPSHSTRRRRFGVYCYHEPTERYWLVCSTGHISHAAEIVRRLIMQGGIEPPDGVRRSLENLNAQGRGRVKWPEKWKKTR
jgi:hypothetical protein